ncbi:TPA: Gfo/Idh/MocA family oxidoreductase, partial [Candidatus Poribacteria bacterium]|nr:Gfo/Idh/MocA family oxidoreductase [Candidatus Poribacteria bacterium]
MEPIKIALIGCGGMSGAHMNAFRALWNKELKLFDIVATCDVVEERAQERAKQAEEFQGKKPSIFTDFQDMLDKIPDIEAVDICTLHSEHHSIAVPCLDAGKHVIIEKPLGITMRACKLMLDASVKAQRVLAVAENYRLSVHERMRRWAIQQGRIGKPRMFFWQDVGESLG